MPYVLISIVLWIILVGLNTWSAAEETMSGDSAVIQEGEIITGGEKQETLVDQVQPSRDEKPTKEQLRAVIRAKRERLRAEMKGRKESLRTEGAEVQQEIMAKRARMHTHPKSAAEMIVQPAN